MELILRQLQTRQAELNLTHLELQDKGVRIVADALRENQVLPILILSCLLSPFCVGPHCSDIVLALFIQIIGLAMMVHEHWQTA
jgi:hypothetical protein